MQASPRPAQPAAVSHLLRAELLDARDKTNLASILMDPARGPTAHVLSRSTTTDNKFPTTAYTDCCTSSGGGSLWRICGVPFKRLVISRSTAQFTRSSSCGFGEVRPYCDGRPLGSDFGVVRFRVSALQASAARRSRYYSQPHVRAHKRVGRENKEVAQQEPPQHRVQASYCAAVFRVRPISRASARNRVYDP